MIHDSNDLYATHFLRDNNRNKTTAKTHKPFHHTISIYGITKTLLNVQPILNFSIISRNDLSIFENLHISIYFANIASD